MASKKQNSRRVLKGLIDYLILSLNELKDVQRKTMFAEGEITAYVECLEYISRWTGYKKYGIEDIERQFPIE